MLRLGVVGGTGLLELALGDEATGFGVQLIREDSVLVETEWGSVPLTCLSIEHSGQEKELIFLQRHHDGSLGGFSRPPHNIEHRANISALASAGCDAIVAVCSVGTLVDDFPPGMVGLADQYIDFTGVATTFHDEKAEFTSVTRPFDVQLNEFLADLLRANQNLSDEQRMSFTYWLTQGPQFETPAEVAAIASLGGHMVGMTMPREAKLAAELAIPYVAICISSNWAAGCCKQDPTADLDHVAVSTEANSRLGPVWNAIYSCLDFEFES